ncbi:MAG: DNA-binding protein [Candidatus Diapherotrites archaeon]|nr:DNA-binding protein [Candidatus Diapherotrites archaeon]
MSDLEQIREKKMQFLRQQMEAQRIAEEKAAAIEVQKQAILKRVLTTEARSRLTNLKLANPTIASQVENLIIYLYQSGQIAKIDDNQLKTILYKIQGRRREPRIIRK